MRRSLISAFVAARSRLEDECDRIRRRIADIERALEECPEIPPGEVPGAASSPEPATPPEPPAAVAAPQPSVATLPEAEAGSLNLREAVILALASGPATRPDILRRVHQIGYRFNKANPVEALDALLSDPRLGIVTRGRRFARA